MRVIVSGDVYVREVFVEGQAIYLKWTKALIQYIKTTSQDIQAAKLMIANDIATEYKGLPPQAIEYIIEQLFDDGIICTFS